MQRCHITQWHVELSVQRRQECRSGQHPYRTTPLGEQYTSNPCFLVGCWSPIDCAWVSSGSRSMSQNCASHSARHSGLPQTCSALDRPTPWNFRGATVGRLCNRTALVGYVPKGKWRLPWRIVAMDETWARSQEPNWNVNQMKEAFQHGRLARWCRRSERRV